MNIIDRALQVIRSEGHLVVCTGEPVRISYTIGLTPRLGYEVFVVGLPPGVAQHVLNGLARKLLASEVADNTPVEEVANVPLRLAFVPQGDTPGVVARLRMIPALNYAPARVRQLLIPDTLGVFPGEEGYSLPFDQTLDETGI